MTYIVDRNVPGGAQMAAGLAPGWTCVHKFGRHLGVGSGFVPVSIGGIYRTPQVAGATALRVKAGNANDTAAGTGAREITLVGLDETGAEVTEAVATAGESASSNTTATFTRLYRAYVSASGTYATAVAGSHSADIVIENAAGTEDWLTISSTGFPRGQSEVAVYTVPLGFTGYVTNIVVSVESTKPADFLMFQRQGILQTAAPYDAMRVVIEMGGVDGEEVLTPYCPRGPFPALTDIGFMAKAAASTPEVNVDFEILLWDGT